VVEEESAQSRSPARARIDSHVGAGEKKIAGLVKQAVS
jgi:hypothetical protein